MTVWVVTLNCGEVLGVFLSEEKARLFVADRAKMIDSCEDNMDYLDDVFVTPAVVSE